MSKLSSTGNANMKGGEVKPSMANNKNESVSVPTAVYVGDQEEVANQFISANNGLVMEQPATVSVQCSSLGENGETVVNTIEVSTEELISIGQLNAEEVEFVYSPDVQYRVDGMGEVGSHVECGGTEQAQEIELCKGQITHNSGIRALRITGGKPRLVIQGATDKIVAEQTAVDNRSEVGEKHNEERSLTSNAAYTMIQDPSENSNCAYGGKHKSTKSASLNDVSSHPNIILTSDIEGLEEQIPVIIQTATLAQETVSAALKAKPVVVSGSTEGTPMASTGKSFSFKPKSIYPARSAATVKIEVSGGGSVQLQKYYCQPGLCRVCLLEKENLTSIFADVVVDSNGIVENDRGPKASNKFHLLAALKTLLDIEVKYNDGLPQEICMACYDQIMNFSAYRKQIAIGQAKLIQILDQVKYSNNPTFIPSLGEVDIQRTNIYKNTESIISANKLRKSSQYSHLVTRNISDRTWDKIFSLLSSMVGYKSGKIRTLEPYATEAPYVIGFFCYTCNCTIHGSKEDFVQHHYDCHGIISAEDVMYPCDICGISYPLKHCTTGQYQSYFEHWLHHFFFHECTFCDKKLPSSKALWAHKKSVHRRKESIFVCAEDGCQKSFSTKLDLDSHKRSHFICQIDDGRDGGTTERPWECDAETCQKRFKTKSALHIHKEAVHMNIRKYVCNICNDSFKSPSSKTAHLLKHKGERNQSCSICSQNFFTRKELKSHMIKHQDVGTFPCTECSKVFKRSAYLADHKRTHTGETPFQCSACDRSFRMKSNYFKHLRIHKRKKEIQ